MTDGMKPALADSATMRLFRRIGMDSVAWSLRRVHCPVDSQALVLEVGSGGNPYARANVLLDAYEDTQERHWAPLKVDRPFVFGFIERLPFRDKAFDFVIASHVLEHSPEPEAVLAEFQRVGKAGYIEVPDAFMERINPYKDHRAEITIRDGRLMIRKKPHWVVDPELVELYEHRAKRLVVRELIQRHPFAFHVRYYWRDEIRFTVVNPDAKATWQAVAADHAATRLNPGALGRLRALARDVLRAPLSQRRRNHTIDLLKLMACPACRSERLSPTPEVVRCDRCGAAYPVRGGIPVMNHRPA